MFKAKLIAVLIFILFIFALLYKSKTAVNSDQYLKDITEENVIYSSQSIQMYFYIKKYAAEFKIPEAYAFALAYQETRYQGPLDTNYKANLVSSAGAVGPMQILPGTADWIHKKHVSKTQLKTDIRLNVKTSMMLLRLLHNEYHDWGLVFGWYNTGTPYVNQYSRNILSKQYIWIK